MELVFDLEQKRSKLSWGLLLIDFIRLDSLEVVEQTSDATELDILGDTGCQISVIHPISLFFHNVSLDSVSRIRNGCNPKYSAYGMRYCAAWPCVETVGKAASDISAQ